MERGQEIQTIAKNMTPSEK